MVAAERWSQAVAPMLRRVRASAALARLLQERRLHHRSSLGQVHAATAAAVAAPLGPDAPDAAASVAPTSAGGDAAIVALVAEIRALPAVDFRDLREHLREAADLAAAPEGEEELRSALRATEAWLGEATDFLPLLATQRGGPAPTGFVPAVPGAEIVSSSGGGGRGGADNDDQGGAPQADEPMGAAAPAAAGGDTAAAPPSDAVPARALVPRPRSAAAKLPRASPPKRLKLAGSSAAAGAATAPADAPAPAAAAAASEAAPGNEEGGGDAPPPASAGGPKATRGGRAAGGAGAASGPGRLRGAGRWAGRGRGGGRGRGRGGGRGGGGAGGAGRDVAAGAKGGEQQRWRATKEYDADGALSLAVKPPLADLRGLLDAGWALPLDTQALLGPLVQVRSSVLVPLSPASSRPTAALPIPCRSTPARTAGRSRRAARCSSSEPPLHPPRTSCGRSTPLTK